MEVYCDINKRTNVAHKNFYEIGFRNVIPHERSSKAYAVIAFIVIEMKDKIKRKGKRWASLILAR
jgi:hypothetical protein